MAPRKVLVLWWMPPGVASISSGASVEGAEEDAAHANPGLRMVLEEPSWGDACMKEVLPSVTLVKERSGTGVLNLFPKVEAQMVLPPY